MSSVLGESQSFQNTGDKDKIVSVENFGDLDYKNLSGAFHLFTLYWNE